MLEVYHILRGDRKPKVIGTLKNNSGILSIRFIPGLPDMDYPFFFEDSVKLGTLEFGDTEVRSWIRQRVMPPERMDLSEYLIATNQDRYDAWEIFKRNNASTTRDTISMVRVK